MVQQADKKNKKSKEQPQLFPQENLQTRLFPRPLLASAKKIQ
jgi:hypothetical protein